jgi:hypothetical protein
VLTCERLYCVETDAFKDVSVRPHGTKRRKWVTSGGEQLGTFSERRCIEALSNSK